jgi:hypothetical protein
MAAPDRLQFAIRHLPTDGSDLSSVMILRVIAQDGVLRIIACRSAVVYESNRFATVVGFQVSAAVFLRAALYHLGAATLPSLGVRCRRTSNHSLTVAARMGSRWVASFFDRGD